MKKIFFGTPDISVYFLEKSKELGFMFDLIITNPPKPFGRKKVLTKSPVHLWAEKNNIPVLTPKTINEEFIQKIKNYELFFVLAYGKILPKKIIEIPKFSTWNLHPSLLPQYRGPSPIMSAILDDQKNTGISLMLLDQKMDHGPIITQKKINITEWKKNSILEKEFAEIGAETFLDVLGDFAEGKITPKPQNHKEATFCKKFEKKDMQLLSPLNSRKNFLKYCAFPKPFYFDENNKRNIVTLAEWKNNNFIIKKIIPEGKKERDF